MCSNEVMEKSQKSQYVNNTCYELYSRNVCIINMLTYFNMINQLNFSVSNQIGQLGHSFNSLQTKESNASHGGNGKNSKTT